MSKKKVEERCKNCGRKDFKFLFLGRDRRFKIPGEFKLVKCKNCNLIFINPLPKQKDLDKYYPKNYYSYEKIKLKENSKTIQLKLFLFDLYFNPKKNKPLLKFFLWPLSLYLRYVKISPGEKLLDIGSGSGQFLYEMKQLGMDPYGVEPGKFDEKGAIKKGLKIKKTNLINAKYPENFFDIITINHVLEHTPNPLEVLDEIKRILKKKGLLIIGVPNYRSLVFYIFRGNWSQLDIPRHLINFSDKILVEILEKKGFKIKKIRHNSQFRPFMVSLFYFLKINPKKYNSLLTVFNLSLFPITFLINFLRLGDQIEILCEK